MKKNNNTYLYEVMYASGLLRKSLRQNLYITSHKKLKIGQFIVVEHIDCGVFIGKVIENRTGEEYNLETIEYRYLQNIDLSNWTRSLEKKEEREKIKKEMELKFKQIDERKKYEYYAMVDEEFNDLYQKYKELEEE